ncbi:MAG: tRNA (adenosine(37)-N6)-threonylcarbamoyltransferase complex ATPase subunit type 1 TsaE [Candidatus Liptonbacteria bacterium]|nr:tRNA (adenosine(37)-N6)-threonylcarbamoyltransferase complex ATPase subunit type 1 TsaE [Candidatus Liptonbacteria bacterium]
MTLRTHSAAETRRAGIAFGQRLLRVGPGSCARVVALSGELGAGKTTFVQGIVRGLGTRRRAASPTFIMIRAFPLKKPFRAVYHVDAYRVRHADEVRRMGFATWRADPRIIILIEWPERLPRLLPADRIRVRFGHGRTENERTIAIAYR